MNKYQWLTWLFISIFSLVLVVVRTQKFGWFQGKDAVLWIVLVYALFRTISGFRNLER